jgi:hypothetical protein
MRSIAGHCHCPTRSCTASEHSIACLSFVVRDESPERLHLAELGEMRCHPLVHEGHALNWHHGIYIWPLAERRESSAYSF